MFTGIIETTAKVLQNHQGRLILERPAAFTKLVLGQSIAVSGVCLTVVAWDDASMTFDMVPETLARTTLGSKAAGDAVNVERAMPADGRFEGHIVQGHVEGTATVRSMEPEGEGMRLTIELLPELARFVIPKGSIAIEGASLTIATINEHNYCSIALIPHTLERTTLGTLRAGDRVNIETDILLRWLHHAHRSNPRHPDPR